MVPSGTGGEQALPAPAVQSHEHLVEAPPHSVLLKGHTWRHLGSRRVGEALTEALLVQVLKAEQVPAKWKQEVKDVLLRGCLNKGAGVRTK